MTWQEQSKLQSQIFVLKQISERKTQVLANSLNIYWYCPQAPLPSATIYLWASKQK